MLRAFKVLTVVFLILALVATGARAATYSVTITSTAFIPASLQISAGDQVIFLNSDAATQSARTTETTGFNTGNIGPGESKTVTLSTAGTYSYYSAFDTTLTGTMTVIAGDGAITDTTETTTTVATTQPQPVSGVFEVMLTLVGGGFAFLGFGWQARRNLRQPASPVLDLPLISSSVEVQRDAKQRS